MQPDAALPLYEDMANQLPQKGVYAERLAFCLFSKGDNLPGGAERNAVLERASAEAKRAQSLGDNGSLLQSMLERSHLGSAPGVQSKVSIAPAALDKMKAAEAEFAEGNIDSGGEIVTADAKALDASDASQNAWLQYQTTRSLRRMKLFAAKHPEEKQYRHTLAEEASALRAAADAVS